MIYTVPESTTESGYITVIEMVTSHFTNGPTSHFPDMNIHLTARLHARTA